jgi:hypothetical protein
VILWSILFPAEQYFLREIFRKILNLEKKRTENKNWCAVKNISIVPDFKAFYVSLQKK